MEPTLPDPRGSRAVLVGVSDYQTLGAIPSARSNLKELARHLRHTDGWGLPEENCTIMQSPTEATKVLDTLAAQASKATDTLLFYFAGHALADDSGDGLHLALGGAGVDRPHANRIPYSWIRYEFLSASRAVRKILILDCCYSGRAIGPPMADDSVMVTVPLDIPGTCVLRSTAGTPRAMAPAGEPYTAFTGEILGTLATGLPDEPELLDLDTLFRYVDQQLWAKGRPRPMRGDLDHGRLVALSRNVAYRPNGGLPPAQPRQVPSPRPPSERNDSEDIDPVPAKARGEDRTIELMLTTKESVLGTEKTVTYDRRVHCGVCGGTGTVDETFLTRGDGENAGIITAAMRPCPSCHGAGLLMERRQEPVCVPAGISNGAELRIGTGLGDAGPGGGPAGELDVRIVVRPGRYYSRRADDLHCDVVLSLSRAALGTRVVLHTYYGREVVPVDAGTQPDTTVILIGKGVRPMSGGDPGDLFVHLRVSTPRYLDREESNLLVEFAELRGETYDAESVDTAYVPIALAALGTRIDVSNDHGAARFHVPPGVQHGTKLRIGRRPQDSRLPQEIEVKIVVPTELTAAQRVLLWRFGKMRDEITPRIIPTRTERLEPPVVGMARLRNAWRRAFPY